LILGFGEKSFDVRRAGRGRGAKGKDSGAYGSHQSIRGGEFDPEGSCHAGNPGSAKSDGSEIALKQFGKWSIGNRL
jgi:hypothetical protein